MASTAAKAAKVQCDNLPSLILSELLQYNDTDTCTASIASSAKLRAHSSDCMMMCNGVAEASVVFLCKDVVESILCLECS